MTHPLGRSLLLVLASLLGFWAGPTSVSNATVHQVEAVPRVIVYTMQGAGLQELLATPGFLGLAQQGGAALLASSVSDDVLRELRHAFGRVRGSVPGVLTTDIGSVADARGAASQAKLDRAANQVAEGQAPSLGEWLVFVVSSPLSNGGVPSDRLGALVMARGVGSELAAAMEQPASTIAGSLTSDSTRRVGVVTSADMAQTAIAAAGTSGETLRDPGGSEIRVVKGPPPIGLAERYVQSKRLIVPVGTAAAVFVSIAGVLALAMLLWPGSPRWSRSLSAWIAISSPFLALSLLLVGHLASLTYATVIPFVVAATALPTLALVPVARLRGTLVAVAVAGAFLLAALAVEACLGWTAALTPLLGGSQLNGGRFFGLPNAFIGLLLGGSIYAAQRLPRTAGTTLIAATGLFAGLPWTGSNMGAAVTLFAAAGIWWGLRGGVGWSRTAAASLAAVLAGAALVVLAHRFLTSAPTHITRFSEQTGGVAGLWDKLVDRLQVGTDLIAANPFALVPVIGVLVTLVVVLRPPASVRITFEDAPVWRDALMAIVLGSVVAYLANDSGAAAIGEGFTTSLGALLFVSLLRRNDIMAEA